MEGSREAISTTGTTLKLEGLTQYNAKSKNIWKNYSLGQRKKLLISVWAPGWDFFSDDAAGKFFSKQQVN